jgi:hypothetical protein
MCDFQAMSIRAKKAEQSLNRYRAGLPPIRRFVAMGDRELAQQELFLQVVEGVDGDVAAPRMLFIESEPVDDRGRRNGRRHPRMTQIRQR